MDEYNKDNEQNNIIGQYVPVYDIVDKYINMNFKRKSGAYNKFNPDDMPLEFKLKGIKKTTDA